MCKERQNPTVQRWGNMNPQKRDYRNWWCGVISDFEKSNVFEKCCQILIGAHGRNSIMISPGICWNLNSQKAYIKQMCELIISWRHFGKA